MDQLGDRPIPPPLLHLPPGARCPGCDRALEYISVGQVDVWVQTVSVVGPREASLSYCDSCGDGILKEDVSELVMELDTVIRGRIGKSVPISEDLVREIAQNLGVTQHLEEALVEKVFGKNWTGKPPEGAIMNRFVNRDRLVAFVVGKLKDLWTLEA